MPWEAGRDLDASVWSALALFSIWNCVKTRMPDQVRDLRCACLIDWGPARCARMKVVMLAVILVAVISHNTICRRQIECPKQRRTSVKH